MPAPFAMPWDGVLALLVAPLVFRVPRWDGGSIPPISTMRSHLIFGHRVSCPPAGPGCFVGPDRCVCRWAAARPRDRHTRAALGVVDLEARPGPAATHRHRGQALRLEARPCPPVPPAPSTPVGLGC